MNADVLAKITFYPTKAGGRHSPFLMDEYRCMLAIGDVNFDARLYGMEGVSPGQTVTVPIRFLSPAIARPLFPVGATFFVREGRRIAEGFVVESYS